MTTLPPDPSFHLRAYLRTLLLLGVAAAAVFPFDDSIHRFVDRWEVDGDVARELNALQQYGQLTMTCIVAVVFVRVQPRRWRRLLDLWLALGLGFAATYVAKHLVGRVRPEYDDPWMFVGPFGSYQAPGESEAISSWSGDYHLSSMPSSHVVGAVVLSVFLTVVEPRLRGVAIFLAATVGAVRVITRGHYPSDVMVGALIGYAIAAPVMYRCVGVGLLDAVWRVFDRTATPSRPALWAWERAHLGTPVRSGA